MTLIEQARAKLFALADLTGPDRSPDPASVLGLKAELVRLHALIGEEMARKFRGKEGAYIARKIAQAKAYQHGRLEMKLTGSDSTEAAILAAGEDWMREVDAAAEYELYRVFLKSLDNAISHASQVVSYYRSSETNA